MNNLPLITAFIGWCTIINFGVLVFSTIMIVVAGNWVKGIHSRLFGLPEQSLEAIYFNYLAHYKLAIIIVNLTPYIALKIIA